MDIILDTNIIKEDFLLNSTKFRALFDYVKKTGSNIILIDIVLKEVLELYEKELKQTISEGNKFYKKINSMIMVPEQIEGPTLNVERQKELYEKYILNKFKEISFNKDWKVIKHNDSILNPIIEKAIKKEKPFNESGKGFKDAVIWECIKYYCSKIGYSENAFISHNKNDFGNLNPNELFEELKNEVEKIGVFLDYYTSLQEFLKAHAEKIDFMDLKWIESKLDKNGLEKHIIEELNNNCEILARILKEKGYSYFPQIYSVVEANNICIMDYYIYPFSESEFLITLNYTVDLVVANEELIRLTKSFKHDSIFRGDLIQNFSPMDYEND